MLLGCVACDPAPPIEATPSEVAEIETPAREPPTREVEAGEIQRARGRVTLDGAPYSGFVVEHHVDGSLASRAGYVDGRAQGWHEAWYASGQLRHRKYYEAGKREGEHLGWRQSGELQFRRHYLADLSHGKQEFFQLGNRLVEETHFEHGHEGKRYGIVGRNDCVSVVNE
jgi:hypothetical protein